MPQNCIRFLSFDVEFSPILNDIFLDLPFGTTETRKAQKKKQKTQRNWQFEHISNF